eukprot:6558705-Pyramimonas_sp.AAC.1
MACSEGEVYVYACEASMAVLQVGHSRLPLSHWSMHFTWKLCQQGSVRSMSPSSRSSRQMTQFGASTL